MSPPRAPEAREVLRHRERFLDTGSTASIEVYPGLYILSGHPFLYHDKTRTLLLADIHLGYEEAVAEEGVYLPRAQLEYFKREIGSVVDEVSIERVVVIGDLKHRFDRLSRQEKTEITEAVEYLRSRGVQEIVLVRGNHDNYVSYLAERLGVRVVDYLLLDDILLIHGHTDPLQDQRIDISSVRVIVYGHEHPSIVLRDRLGKIGKLPVFLEIPLSIGGAGRVRGIVLPATGFYQLGSPVSLDPEKYLSPITKRYGDINMMRPYILSREEGIVLEMPPLYMMTDFIEV